MIAPLLHPVRRALAACRPAAAEPRRVLAFPRDPNPYLELLYGELRRRGTEVDYIGGATRSKSLNALLLPLELVLGRARGARVLHVHWLFPFGLGWARRDGLRWIPDALLVALLQTAALVGLRVVWTVHNVIPHAAVFGDDVRARRRLLAASDVVIVHAEPALAELRRRVGEVPGRVRVIPLGPFAAPAPRIPRRATRHVAFFGRVEPYKGVEELLEAVALLPPDCPLHLTVAGRCTDLALRGRIERRAHRLPQRITLRLEHLDEPELNALLAAVDAVVLPFRDVTTTSSAAHAAALGVPVLLPDLPALGDLRAGVIRYDGSVTGLTALLHAVGELDPADLDRLGADAYRAAHERTWGDVAAETLAAYRAAAPEGDA
jgi:glycosyltransferase involved in cell wall biosynthesis